MPGSWAEIRTLRYKIKSDMNAVSRSKVNRFSAPELRLFSEGNCWLPDMEVPRCKHSIYFITLLKT